MKKIVALSVILFFLACEPPPRSGSTTGAAITTVDKFITSDQVLPNEEYVMVTTAINLPLYVNHDQKAFKKWGEKMGVVTSILGPSEWDVPSQIATIEQVIPGKPAGLLINGTDPGIAQVIKKAVEAGIPTVVYDSEIRNSNRHSFIGSDWYEMGRLQGERMVKLIGGKGKVACMGILGMENMEAGFKGFRMLLKNIRELNFWVSMMIKPMLRLQQK
jgi:ABC-type sugar transport system substrate-binding protein